MTNNEVGKLQNRRRRELEVMIIAACIALMLAFSIILLVAAALGQSISDWNESLLLSVYFILTAFIWGFLVFINS